MNLPSLSFCLEAYGLIIFILNNHSAEEVRAVEESR